MHIGHINLSASLNDTGEHFITLIETLQSQGEEQHIVVRNAALARRLHILDNVTVSPLVRSPVSAFCLMPSLDIVHVHDPAAGQAGLLLTLTRSIPFVLTHRGPAPGNNPLAQAVYRRANLVICLDDCDQALLRHYDPSLPLVVIPDIARCGSVSDHLRVYQNSQRMPIAGSSGSQ